MKKYLTLALLGLVGTAAAVTPFGPSGSTLWQCNAPNYNNYSGLNYCRLVMRSTTTSGLGSVNVNAAQHIYVVGSVSGSAVSGVVTPTLSFSLGGKVVGTQNISATSTPNVVDLGNVPYFDTISVSESTPTLISSTNALVITVIGNDK